MNANEIIKSIEAEQLKAEVPEFSVGDTADIPTDRLLMIP